MDKGTTAKIQTPGTARATTKQEELPGIRTQLILAKTPRIDTSPDEEGRAAMSGEDALPPPHPALVAMVRLLARTHAHQARADLKETR